MFLPKNRVDNASEAVLVVLEVAVDDNDGAEFLASVEHILLGNLLAEEPLDLIGDALADLVVLVDALVVLGERVVAIGEHEVPGLQLAHVQGHPLALIGHGPKF